MCNYCKSSSDMIYSGFCANATYDKNDLNRIVATIRFQRPAVKYVCDVTQDAAVEMCYQIPPIHLLLLYRGMARSDVRLWVGVTCRSHHVACLM